LLERLPPSGFSRLRSGSVLFIAVPASVTVVATDQTRPYCRVRREPAACGADLL